MKKVHVSAIGTIVLAILLGIGGASVADAGTIVASQNFFLNGLNSEETILLPGFSGPGFLDAVTATYTVNDNALAIYTDASQPGQTATDIQASQSVSLVSQTAPFHFGPGTLTLSIPPTDDPFVPVGKSFIVGTDNGNVPFSVSFTPTDLAAFPTGPLAFTFASTGTSSGTLTPDVVLDVAATFGGTFSVIYTYSTTSPEPSPVPEPRGVALFGIGLVGILATRRLGVARR
ncbi:MAG: hypothetical protein ACREFH_05775 [Stellaceae bacterium]